MDAIGAWPRRADERRRAPRARPMARVPARRHAARGWAGLTCCAASTNSRGSSAAVFASRWIRQPAGRAGLNGASGSASACSTCAYGDQALFARRTVFEELGGYRELPLMEDVDFVRRLRRRGRLEHADVPALTSARRWERDGWFGGPSTTAARCAVSCAGARRAPGAPLPRRTESAPG